MASSPLDPHLFRPEAIDTATRAFNLQLEQILASAPSILDRGVAETRGLRASGQGTFGPIVKLDQGQDRWIRGPAGKIGLRVFVPHKVEGVYLHIHGGGWVFGGADMQDESLAAIANGCNVAVVSVDYRLAPEDPYPAGPDDCEAAAVWLAKKATSEFGSDRLLIGGESAGAHLAVVTLLRLRDRHGFSGFRGAALTYGMYDFTLTPSVAGWGSRNLILSTPIIEWFRGHFLAGHDPRDPDVSPLYADLTGLPPALFTVGTLDPLRDDSLFMHARWLAASIDSDLAVYPGGVHAFNMFPIEIGRQANARIARFISERSSAP
jgi:acetyl esterase